MQETTMAAPPARNAAHKENHADGLTLARSDIFVNINITVHEVRIIGPFIRQRLAGPRPAVTLARRDSEERQREFTMDLVCGMLAELAFHKYLFGPHDGLHRYIAMREIMAAYPVTAADSGNDVCGCNIDVKSSRWPLDRTPGEAHLILPLRKFSDPQHAQRVYCLALGAEREDQSWSFALPGWITGAEIEPCEHWRFRGCAAVEASTLHPWPPLRWEFGGGS